MGSPSDPECSPSCSSVRISTQMLALAKQRHGTFEGFCRFRFCCCCPVHLLSQRSTTVKNECRALSGSMVYPE